MEILWKTLTWTLSLVLMAASEFQSRLSYNSQGKTKTAEGSDPVTYGVPMPLFCFLSLL